jgi:PAS domain S-box-containing protein
MPSVRSVKTRRIRDRNRKKYASQPRKVSSGSNGTNGVSPIGTAQQAIARLREAIVITDTDVKDTGPQIIYINRAFTRMTGYLPREVVGKNLEILQGPQTALCTLKRLRGSLGKGRKFEGEDIIYRKDNSQVHVDWYVESLRNERGRVAYFVTVFRDLTRQREGTCATMREQRLEGIGLLARSIAHDLNNILTPILMGSDLLDRKVDDPDTTQLAAMLDRSADRGAGLVKQLIALSRGLNSASRTVARNGRCRSILIIDDEVAVAEMVREILAGAGHKVATANTVSDALDRAQQVLPDTILLSLRMARAMDNSLIMEFRSRYPRTSLLVTSDLPRDDIPEIVTQTSAILQKPFSVENLLVAVHDVLVPELVGANHRR